MLFNSYIFVLFFLPVTLLVYFGLNHFHKERLAKIFLIGMSLWFYAYFHLSYLAILLGSIVINYGISRWMYSVKLSNIQKKMVLAGGILLNVGVIFYYKYYNFFLENINWIFGEDFATKSILMPLGISFFTFQQISYLVDSYRGETKDYGFIDYALFVSFFPQLIAGPIVLHDEMIPQFSNPARKKINQDMLAKGIWIFSVGLFKKVMIADTLGKAADYGFSNVTILSGMDTWIVIICYTLQLYFDFSGYCDMAIGIANMLHMELPLNFNSPYKATSVTEFWKRWHMTLTRFLRKYVYFPLGGNRKGYARTLVNIMIVYLVSGIWHGAAWTFIVWGVLHGAVRVLEKICWNWLERIPKIIRWGGTFLFINLAWVIFRADSLGDVAIMYANLLDLDGGMHSALLSQFDLLEFTYVVEHVDVLAALVEQFPWIYMAIVMAVALVLALFMRNCHEKEFKPTLPKALGSIVLLVWDIVSFSGLSTFLYFNF